MRLGTGDRNDLKQFRSQMTAGNGGGSFASHNGQAGGGRGRWSESGHRVARTRAVDQRDSAADRRS